MAARNQFFHSSHLPVLSAEENTSQSEEINVIDESQAANRPEPAQDPSSRVARFAGAPSLHVNRPLVMHAMQLKGHRQTTT